TSRRAWSGRRARWRGSARRRRSWWPPGNEWGNLEGRHGLEATARRHAAGQIATLRGVGGGRGSEPGSVSVVALHRELARVAVAAVDAHRVEGDLVRRLRGVDLGHRQPHVVVRVRGGIVD